MVNGKEGEGQPSATPPALEAPEVLAETTFGVVEEHFKTPTEESQKKVLETIGKSRETLKARAAADLKAKEEAEKNKPVIPETYEPKTEAGSPVDPDRLKELAAEAKEGKMTQAQFEALVKREEATVGRYAQKKVADYKTLVEKTWPETITATYGEKTNEVVSQVKEVIDAVASPEEKKLLDDSGLGNHPVYISLLHKVIAAAGIVPKNLIKGAPSPGGKQEPQTEDQAAKTFLAGAEKQASGVPG